MYKLDTLLGATLAISAVNTVLLIGIIVAAL